MSVNPEIHTTNGIGLNTVWGHVETGMRINDLEAEVGRLKAEIAAQDEQIKFRNEAIAGWERIAQFWKTKSQEVEDRVAGHPVPPGQPDLRTPNPDGEDWYRVQDLQARMNRAERRLDVLEGVRPATRGDR